MRQVNLQQDVRQAKRERGEDKSELDRRYPYKFHIRFFRAFVRVVLKEKCAVQAVIPRRISIAGSTARHLTSWTSRHSRAAQSVAVAMADSQPKNELLRPSLGDQGVSPTPDPFETVGFVKSGPTPAQWTKVR